MSAANSTATDLDAVVVGAGFAGIYALQNLRSKGFRTRVYEAANGVGGTWYWNRYPGARCDIPSLQYSYSFDESLQQEWRWKNKYSDQADILDYANHVVERFDLRKDMQFNTRIVSATFDESNDVWTITTDAGESVTARHFVLATGCLSTSNIPEFEGFNDYQGEAYHSGRWPEKPVDLTGKKVAIIGCGSTAIQAIPAVAEIADHLYSFQRTPQFTIPQHNEPLNSEIEKQIKSRYADYRNENYRSPFAQEVSGNFETNTFDVSDEERNAEYERRWQMGGFAFLVAYADSGSDRVANETIADFVRNKIRGIVKDPQLAEKLCPNFVYASKRPVLDTNYFETFNRDNVTLVDIRDNGIERFTETGIRANGINHEVDCVIFATGFDALTGTLNKMEIRGRGGRLLKDKWAEGPKAYLGLCAEGFPNMYVITGPGSPSVLTNMMVAIEQHVNFVADTLVHMRDNEQTRIEAKLEAEEPWVAHVSELGHTTLFTAGANWYFGDNIPGKPRVFLPHVDWVGYVEKCEEVVEKNYDGFSLA